MASGLRPAQSTGPGNSRAGRRLISSSSKIPYGFVTNLTFDQSRNVHKLRPDGANRLPKRLCFRSVNPAEQRATTSSQPAGQVEKIFKFMSNHSMKLKAVAISILCGLFAIGPVFAQSSAVSGHVL